MISSLLWKLTGLAVLFFIALLLASIPFGIASFYDQPSQWVPMFGLAAVITAIALGNRA